MILSKQGRGQLIDQVAIEDAEPPKLLFGRLACGDSQHSRALQSAHVRGRVGSSEMLLCLASGMSRSFLSTVREVISKLALAL